MVIHVYHPYRQPDGINHCAAVNGHCSHLCLPAPQVGPQAPRVSCACPQGLRLMPNGLMCVEDGKFFFVKFHHFQYYFPNICMIIIIIFILFYITKVSMVIF